MGLTLYEKIWQSHLVSPESPETPGVMFVDLHLLHEVSSPQAFTLLRSRGLRVRRPERCLATLDHAIPTLPPGPDGALPYVSEQAALQVETLRRNCHANGIRLLDRDSTQRGIVHVIGPELGATQPGMTIVCGDSHTSTHGAFGALAFGIGATEAAHVLATQCLLQRRSKTMRIEVSGTLAEGVSAKDLILHIISEIGVGGASGHVIEYCGPVVRDLDMEARMTLCNMSIECGARAGLIAPDEKTYAYLEGRPMLRNSGDWADRVAAWRRLRSDADARFDRHLEVHAGLVRPTITYGTNPGMAMPVAGRIPLDSGDSGLRKSLEYMGLKAGDTLLGKPVDVVFIGSCTNARISDLQVAGAVLKNRKVAPHTRVIIVPGSEAVKREAESLGLARIFRDAGAEWRNPGCSMCIAMNGDAAAPGELVVSTSNRNFEGRQGAGARTLLASPRTAATCAVAGRVADPDQPEAQSDD